MSSVGEVSIRFLDNRSIGDFSSTLGKSIFGPKKSNKSTLLVAEEVIVKEPEQMPIQQDEMKYNDDLSDV